MPLSKNDSHCENISCQRVESAIKSSSGNLHQLVLVLGADNSPRSSLFSKLALKLLGCSYLNLDLELSKVLRSVPSSERRLVVDNILKELVEREDGGILLMDKLGVLFDPELAFDLARFLRESSRTRVIVASVGGEYVNGVLTYSVQGHSEYKRLDLGDAVVVDLGGVEA